jgi:RHS repeat-associated protein
VPEGKCYLLKEQVKPNGNRLKFTYDYVDDIPFIKTLETYNRKGRLINKIEGENVEDRLIYRTPTHEHAIYHFLKSGYRNDHEPIPVHYLDHIDTSQFGHTSIASRGKSEKSAKKVHYVSKLGGYQQVVNYNSKKKVRSLEHTVGPNDERITTHEFTYYENSSVVKDCFNQKIHFNFDDEKRITSITRVSNEELDLTGFLQTLTQNEQITPNTLRQDRFEWIKEGEGEGWLKEKKVLGKGGLYYTKCYDYDRYGNVTKETLIDNAGNTYPIIYEYSSDGFNLLTRTVKPEGLEHRFGYLPGTNLKTEEWVLINGIIQQRTFIAYDDNGEISEIIVDDGSSSNVEDLTHVTTRRVKKITAVNLEGASYGKPKTIECYALMSNGLCLLNRTEYSYDEQGNEILVTAYDSRGNQEWTISKVYDHLHRVVASTNPLGVTTTFEYDNRSNKIAETCQESGIKTLYRYNAANHLIATESYYPDGEIRTTQFNYDALGRKISETDTFGNITYFSYDALNNQCERVNPEGSKTCTEYNGLNQVISETDAMGRKTCYERNMFGSITKKVFSDGSHELYNYTSAGHLKSIVYTDGTCTAYKRDPLGRALEKAFYDKNQNLLARESYRYKGEHLIEKVDLAGLKTTYTYDGAGRVIALRVGDKVTCFEKDDFDRTITKIESEQIRRTTYDAAGHILSESDEDLQGKLYRKVTYQYNKFGNEIARIIHMDSDTVAVRTTTYTPDQSIASVTDEAGNTTRYTYNRNYLNAAGQRVLETIKTDPLGRQFHTIYDVMGRIHTEALYDSKWVIQSAKTYDLVGNLIEESILNVPVNKSYTITRTYDSLNRILSLTEENEKTTRYSYDSRGRLVAKTLPDGTVISTTFDGLDRPLETKASDGSVHTRVGYDVHGNVISTEDLLSHATTQAVYDIYDRLVQETLPDGTTLSYAYDELDRLTALTLPDGSNVLYFYDPYHLRVLRRESLGYEITFDAYDQRGLLLKRTTPAGATTFTYDALGRLITRTSDNYSLSCDAYDAVSNLLQETETLKGVSAIKRFAYNSQDYLIHEEGLASNTFIYDALGNCLSENETPREHNRLNQLTKTAEETLTYDKNGRLLSRSENGIVYGYDALGRLRTYTTPEKQYNFSYTSGPRLLKFSDSNSEVSLLYFGDHEVGTVRKGVLTEFKILDPTRPESTLAVEVNGSPYFAQQDSRGNITILDDRAGKLAEAYTYSAFKELSSSATPLTPWRFANRRTLESLSLFTYRFYDPTLRRWLTPDPLDFEDGYNLYTYNQNNPLRYYDPDGRFVWIFAAATFALGESIVLSTSTTYILTTMAAAATAYVGAHELSEYDRRNGTHYSRDFCEAGNKMLYCASAYTLSAFSTQTPPQQVPECQQQPSPSNPTPEEDPDDKKPSSGTAAAAGGSSGGAVIKQQIDRNRKTPTAKNVNEICVRNSNTEKHITQSKHAWDKVIEMSGNPEQDCKRVIKLLEDNRIFSKKYRLDPVEEFGEYVRYNHQMNIQGYEVKAIFNENVKTGQIFLNDAWVITK